MIICLKRFELKSTLVISLVFLLNSCAPVYIPNVVNVPNFKEKGEFQVAAYAGNFGIDGQLAYALSDHVGIIVNTKLENYSNSTGEAFRKQKYAELGVGHFEEIGVDEKLILEFYGGVGYGFFEGRYDEVFVPKEVMEAQNARIFLQGSLSATIDRFDISIGGRVVHVRMKQDIGAESSLFLEPVIMAKIGQKKIKGIFQSGLSLPFSQGPDDFDYQPYFVSVGIQARFRRGASTED